MFKIGTHYHYHNHYYYHYYNHYHNGRCVYALLLL